MKNNCSIFPFNQIQMSLRSRRLSISRLFSAIFFSLLRRRTVISSSFPASISFNSSGSPDLIVIVAVIDLCQRIDRYKIIHISNIYIHYRSKTSVTYKRNSPIHSLQYSQQNRRNREYTYHKIDISVRISVLTEST